MTFRFHRDGSHESVGHVSVTTDEWHHVAATFDNEALRLFIDGELVGEALTGPGPADDYPGVLRIGAAAYADNFFFNGLIDEVRLSSVARYVADFALPPRRLPIEDDHTVALWHFDEPDGEQKVVDATGVHDGALGKSQSVGDDDPSRLDVPCELE